MAIEELKVKKAYLSQYANERFSMISGGEEVTEQALADADLLEEFDQFAEDMKKLVEEITDIEEQEIKEQIKQRPGGEKFLETRYTTD